MQRLYLFDSKAFYRSKQCKYKIVSWFLTPGTDSIQKGINENAHIALDQSKYQKKYDELVDRYNTIKSRIEELNTKISEMNSQRGSYKDFLRAFKRQPDSLTEFSLDSFNGLVDFITVYGEEDIRVTFRNGQEVRASSRRR